MSREAWGCPDENHPHKIDLGLPSGTQWACCNVNAASPEGYGGYFAWGETSEKDVYNSTTYQHYCSNGITVDIELWDISGTIYDAATTKWGASWRMPTEQQYRELISNTTKKWTTLKGVNGWELTGANGHVVFFPAADVKLQGTNDYIGHLGSYWSSTIEKADNHPHERYPELYPDIFPDDCYSFDFNSMYLNIDYGIPHAGKSIRAISSE